MFHRYKKTGLPKTNKDSGLPKMDKKVLIEHLTTIATNHGIEVAKTATGQFTTSINEFWKEHRHAHPLIEAYCGYTELTKLRTFFVNLKEPIIHPRYRVFVRTGRTSCSSPNIQQLPRGSHVREVVIASPGCLLLIIDFSAIELVTLAAVCFDGFVLAAALLAARRPWQGVALAVASMAWIAAWWALFPSPTRYLVYDGIAVSFVLSVLIGTAVATKASPAAEIEGRASTTL